MTKKKYGDVDALTESVKLDDLLGPSPGRRRRSPALQVAMGEKSQPASYAESFRGQIALLESEKEELKRQLSEARESATKMNPGTDSIVLTMPVSRKKVSFTLQHVPTDRIVVSEENERVQEYLDILAISDIHPSMEDKGQQKPGTLRPRPNGMFQLIEGSRRLASAKISGRPFMALVGDVPDEDVRELSVIENKRRDVSIYERAVAYAKQIENGEYANWSQLAAAKNISTTHAGRLKSFLDVDELFIKILRSPSDLTSGYALAILELQKRNINALRAKGKELLQLRESAVANGTDFLEADEILRLLKSSVKPVPNFSVSKEVLRSEINRELSVEISGRKSGAMQLVFKGVRDDQFQLIKDFLEDQFKLSR